MRLPGAGRERVIYRGGVIETPVSESVWDHAARPEPVAGQTPEAYTVERYAVADSGDDVPNGEGTERRAHTDAQGRRRNLTFPALPEPLPHPVVDNHTHLDMQDGLVRVSVVDAMATARDASVCGVVQAGCDVESSRFAVAAAQTVPRVLAAVALHPNEAPTLAGSGVSGDLDAPAPAGDGSAKGSGAGRFESDGPGGVSAAGRFTGARDAGSTGGRSLDEALAVIDELAGQRRVRCVGETGMDRVHTPESGLAVQEESFRAHIEIAKRHGVAMQIHDREAHEDVVRILRDAGAPERTVFHCFSGDAELARLCNENGWYMSFAGTVTFKNAAPLKAALREADPGLVLCETDAPFLTPHPFRGRPNAPYMVNYTVRGMAEILDTDLEELCRRIWENSERVYGQF